ncbi:hypothetical protein TNCT_87051 [Trichonephila clavata]|uniref:Uncharacterized protein n=1 Tax=Trichonephila clavata TaxID=2740835 RepID=A0A8X6IRL9_TRICU|nr:hypothetical protein TNCT_87051 [Trichonephila clavata]
MGEKMNRGQFTCQLQRSPSTWRGVQSPTKKATPPDYFPADNRTFAQALHKKNELKHYALSFMLHAVCPASVQLRRTAVGYGVSYLLSLTLCCAHMPSRFARGTTSKLNALSIIGIGLQPVSEDLFF